MDKNSTAIAILSIILAIAITCLIYLYMAKKECHQETEAAAERAMTNILACSAALKDCEEAQEAQEVYAS